MDKIDQKLLRLLQQRIKLSGQIGKMKRRHHAAVYVPERERELIARLTLRSKGKLPPEVITSLYREIMSHSRAAQGQGPVGLLKASSNVVLPAAHLAFGSWDQFSIAKTWPEMAKGLADGKLSAALITGTDLVRALQSPRWRTYFCKRLDIVGDFIPVPMQKTPVAERIFIVTPQPAQPPRKTSRVVILMECKSTLNAIKSLLRTMPTKSIHAEPLIRRALPSRPGSAVALALLTLDKAVSGQQAIDLLVAARNATGIPVSILGLFAVSEDYGG